MAKTCEHIYRVVCGVAAFDLVHIMLTIRIDRYFVVVHIIFIARYKSRS